MQCVRAFPDSKVEKWEPLLKVASATGFWRMSNDEVQRFATKAGVPEISATTNLCTTISKTAQHSLGKTQEEALDICKKRAGLMAPSAGVSEALLEADECIGMMDEEDRADAVKQKHDTREKQYQAFMEDYVDEKRALAGGAAPKKRAKKQTPKYPDWPPSGITQSVASQLTPPGGSIWRGLGFGSWQCHFPPWPRKSFSWSLYGHDQACKLCLRHMWELYLKELGQTPAQCPIKSIFVDNQAHDALL